MAARRPFKAGFRQNAKEQVPVVNAVLIKQARKSGQVNLSNRNLTEVPDAVWRINIDVPEEGKSVSLEHGDDRWWEQVDLTKLILASNQISQLSEDIHQLPALTVLDVHDNILTCLPEALGGLRNLQRLNLNHNKLTCLPDTLGKLEHLKTLAADHNHISDLGKGIGDLFSLEHLDLSNNQLTQISPVIGNLTGLTTLNLSYNKIQVLPHEIGCIQGLKNLDCTHNSIHTLPDELGNLTKLEQLYLRHNRLAHLPVLHSCSALKELHCGNNAIHGLTVEHLESLQSLSMLDLRDNRLAKLPDEIIILQQLERLDISNNDISVLPYSLGNLTSLKSIVLDGNPMKSIRRDIIMRGTTEIKKHLRSRIAEDDTTPVQVIKEKTGTSGFIGGTGGVDPHTVNTTKVLDYSDKKASEVPPELWGMAEKSEVTSINLSKNLLKEWPLKLVGVGNSLKELNLGVNKIPCIDPSISVLQRLTFIDLRNNLLQELPGEMSSLTSLRELTISFNRFATFPAVIYQLSRLEVLLASDNQIQDIDPEGIKRLEYIATIDLQNNDIMQVPPKLGLCTQIRSLQLEGNPFRQPRRQILAKGTLTLLEYLRDRIVT